MGFGTKYEGLDAHPETPAPGRALDDVRIAHRWALVDDALRDRMIDRDQGETFRWQIWLREIEIVGWAGSELFVWAPGHVRTSIAERYLRIVVDVVRHVLENAAISITLVDGADPTAAARNVPRQSAPGPAERRDPRAQDRTLDSPPERTES